MSIRQVKIFNGFERFWHWTQMALIMVLLVTGFGIHGFYHVLDFNTQVTTHIVAAIGLMILWVFAIFWHLTTGTWRHYVPTTNGLLKMARFYAWGIFKGEHHPYRKAYWRKHNPLQALSYLGLKLVLFPLIWVSGLLYLLYGFWGSSDFGGTSLQLVALTHTAIAFAMLVFIIIHVYLLTTGDSFIEHVKPMITGYDEVDLSPAEEAYLREDDPRRIKMGSDGHSG